jgi:hypothetical protein
VTPRPGEADALLSSLLDGGKGGAGYWSPGPRSKVVEDPQFPAIQWSSTESQKNGDVQFKRVNFKQVNCISPLNEGGAKALESQALVHAVWGVCHMDGVQMSEAHREAGEEGAPPPQIQGVLTRHSPHQNY